MEDDDALQSHESTARDADAAASSIARESAADDGVRMAATMATARRQAG